MIFNVILGLFCGVIIGVGFVAIYNYYTYK